MSEVEWRAGKTHTSRRRAKPCSNQGDGYNSRTVKGDRASTNLTFMKGRQKAGSGAWGWVSERSGTTHRLRLGLSGMLERLADRIGTDQPIAAALVPPTVAALLHKSPRLQRISSQLHSAITKRTLPEKSGTHQSMLPAPTRLLQTTVGTGWRTRRSSTRVPPSHTPYWSIK